MNLRALSQSYLEVPSKFLECPHHFRQFSSVARIEQSSDFFFIYFHSRGQFGAGDVLCFPFCVKQQSHHELRGKVDIPHTAFCSTGRWNFIAAINSPGDSFLKAIFSLSKGFFEVRAIGQGFR